MFAFHFFVVPRILDETSEKSKARCPKSMDSVDSVVVSERDGRWTSLDMIPGAAKTSFQPKSVGGLL